MTSITGAVRRCAQILQTGKALEKTPRRVIPPVRVKYRSYKLCPHLVAWEDVEEDTREELFF
jgi:hypothetical protein